MQVVTKESKPLEVVSVEVFDNIVRVDYRETFKLPLGKRRLQNSDNIEWEEKDGKLHIVIDIKPSLDVG